MPCCCICKSPFALIAVAGLSLGVVFAAMAQPGDKKVDPPKTDAPAPTTAPAKTTEPAKKDEAKADPFVLGFKMKDIDGKEQDLAQYKGKVVLIVNVASQCGYTKQYSGLEKLYEEKKDAGLVILAFPANDFREQEPGSNAEIKQFCTSKYGVKFPMFEKVVVKGKEATPLYKRLAAQPSPIGGEPKWNFTKFLVDRNGNVVNRYEPGVKPDDKVLTDRIEELLKAKPDSKAGSPRTGEK